MRRFPKSNLRRYENLRSYRRVVFEHGRSAYIRHAYVALRLTYAKLRRSFKSVQNTPRTAHGVWQELRVIRTKDNHSLTALAAAADMSLGYLSDLERGRHLPSAEATRKLAAALNVPMSVLERKRHVDSDGNDIALRDMIRQIVREELAAAGAA